MNCDNGGVCSNVQWEGYTCDNEFFVQEENGSIQLLDGSGEALDPSDVTLMMGVTYRITAVGNLKVCASLEDGTTLGCASGGPLLFVAPEGDNKKIVLTAEQGDDKSVSFELSVFERQSPKDADDGLSTGAIAGIAVGIAVVVLVIIGVVAMKMLPNKQPSEKSKDVSEGSSDENP